ncbi:hypothetical protein E0Z10_g4612 [Xylaria hypoxylon]|uniref:Kelch repeat-containing protein n=1 Tax=Xylaria hypoxylon TaxID=37992 RepID=A0A4Z0Z3K9_9PEZI|nr:hypothetical protein E0Z10_g4612 [Xylaria hypoxylon]
MTSSRAQHNTSDPGEQRPRFERPRFNSQVTSHRLAEGLKFMAVPTSSKIRKGRKSVFREIGLDEDDDGQENAENSAGRQSLEEKQSNETTRRRSDSASSAHERKGSVEEETTREKSRWLSRLIPEKRPKIKSAATAPPAPIGGLHRFTLIAMLMAVVIPALGYNNGRQKVKANGADAGVIREPVVRGVLEDRANSPTNVCKRWAGQSAVLNGTLYYYGGRAKTTDDQTTNTWTNDFITIDLTKSWDVSSPSVSGVPQPSGPPAVSLGYLWNDFDHLYLYGGEFDFPSSEPLPVSTWMYDIASSTWTEYKDLKTSAGEFSDAGNVPIQRAAEGSGVSVPELGLSWYFGGHLDWATTPGWTNQIPRVYLKSLLEFTHPGYSNVQVNTLQHSGAPDSGAYRNITWAGEQNQDGFAERADGVLVYVPGWGPGGVLLGLGGGVVSDNDTTDTFSSMTTIDVYDIASSQWYHQETSGDEKPGVRVNPCAVVFSAPDASSFNIYMYGGQNLLPVGDQKQYTDVWILTIPSFTWIKVDVAGDEPPPRAGHSCEARDGQIVVVGGYIGEDIPCEQPGIFAFDASNLAWQSSFNAADHAADDNADNTVLAGSYGYQVPGAVQSVVGGSSAGGATATQPASGPATDGPFKTGVPPVFTVTGSASTATVTNPGIGYENPGSSDGNSNSNAPRGGTIAAGVIAGTAGLLALYLGFCAWLWRRQVRAYKRHMAVANGYGGENIGDSGIAAAAAGERLRKKDPNSTGGAIDGDGDQFAWVGRLHPGEPKFMTSSDEPSPGSGTGYGSSERSHSIDDRGPWGIGYDSYAGGAIDLGGGIKRSKSNATWSTRSDRSAEALLDGREPNFFSVVLGPRRALRVVNGMEE